MIRKTTIEEVVVEIKERILKLLISWKINYKVKRKWNVNGGKFPVIFYKYSSKGTGKRLI